jgi:hypothetical protein
LERECSQRLLEERLTQNGGKASFEQSKWEILHFSDLTLNRWLRLCYQTLPFETCMQKAKG